MNRENQANPGADAPSERGKQGEPATQRDLSPREKAAQKRIRDLRRRLLDLSNSNRLLNYKLSSRTRRQIGLVDELPNELLRMLLGGERLVFKALPELDNQPTDEKGDEFLLALEQAKRSDENYLAVLKNLNEEDNRDCSESKTHFGN